MVSRRGFLGAVVSAGVAVTVPVAIAEPASAAPAKGGKLSNNGWRIDRAAIQTYRIEGSGASIALHRGTAAVVLLHVARRWHYEIGRLDTGEGGGAHGYLPTIRADADYESNYLSGTAIALFPTAYPVNGFERLSPLHETIVRDILADCEGSVAWGGDFTPRKHGHFHVIAAANDPTLRAVGRRLDTTAQRVVTKQTPGQVDDPNSAARRAKAAKVRAIR